MINLELKNSGREMQNQTVDWVEIMPWRKMISLQRLSA